MGKIPDCYDIKTAVRPHLEKHFQAATNYGNAQSGA